MIARAVRPLCFLTSVNLASFALAGSLDPPETPHSTPGPEPRIAINAVNTPGNEEAVFRITEPGSYYLEDNLTVAFVAKNGIAIEASNVAVDLCGFRVDAFEVHVLPGAGAANPTSLTGILASGDLLENISVRNGVVRDWRVAGIDLRDADGCLILDVIASDNAEEGIWVGDDAALSRCIASDNDAVGIEAGDNCAVEGCVASGNGASGISIGGGVVSECTAWDNSGHGFRISLGTVVIGCAAQGNTTGFFATASGNRIEGNLAKHNTAQGFYISGYGNLVVRNHAYGNGQSPADNYNIEPGSPFGPLVTDTAGGEITSTNPWANFSF